MRGSGGHGSLSKRAFRFPVPPHHVTFETFDKVEAIKCDVGIPPRTKPRSEVKRIFLDEVIDDTSLIVSLLQSK